MTTFVRAGLFALLASASFSACERRTAPRAPALGAAAPAFTAMTLEGEPVTLAALSGSVVVLNVWATWGIPCREEIPQLEALHREYGAKGLKTIGVSIDAAGMEKLNLGESSGDMSALERAVQRVNALAPMSRESLGFYVELHRDFLRRELDHHLEMAVTRQIKVLSNPDVKARIAAVMKK